MSTIGTRERIAVDIASLFVGTAIILVTDGMAGLAFGTSIFNLGVVIIVGVIVSLTYNALMKRQYLKDRQAVLP